jgi:hypothetical protein
MANSRIARLSLAAIAALAIAGCGPLGGESEEASAGDTLTELVEARNQGEFGTVCDLLSAQDLARFDNAGVSCEQTLRQRFPTGTTTTIRIEEVRVKDDRASIDATVSQTGGAGRAQTFLLIKEEGEWKFPLQQAGG